MNKYTGLFCIFTNNCKFERVYFKQGEHAVYNSSVESRMFLNLKGNLKTEKKKFCNSITLYTKPIIDLNDFFF